MKTKLVLTLFTIFTLFLVGSSRGAAQGDVSVAALGTAITYQGRLTDGGVSANSTYDFQFTLYNDVTGGAQVDSRAIYRHFSGFGFILLSIRIQSRQLAANANR